MFFAIPLAGVYSFRLLSIQIELSISLDAPFEILISIASLLQLNRRWLDYLVSNKFFEERKYL